MTVRIVLIAVLICLAWGASADGSQTVSTSRSSSSFSDTPALREVSGHIRFTYEELDMPDPGERRLGLFGFHFLTDLGRGFHGGIAGYGALTGERGGFFTGGLAGGTSFHIVSKLSADAGLFVGGGGGGAAPQGGGLMLRGHAGLLLDLAKFRVGASLSRVEFPNGDIESNQLSLNVDFPFAFLAGNGPARGDRRHFIDLPDFAGVGQQEIALKAQDYFLSSHSKSTSGQPLKEDLQLIGFEFRSYLHPRSYWLMESSGALGGDADGYAEVLFGLGYAISPGNSRTFGLETAISVGGAGGGRIDTGGGAIAKAHLGFNLTLAEKYVLAFEGNYLDTLDGGHFSGFGAGIRAGWRMHSAVKNGVFSLKKTWQLDNLEIAAAHHSYLDPQRKSSISDDQNVHLISMQIRRYFDDSMCYFSGQAAGAYEGDAGGYASGLVGPGMRWFPGPDSPFGVQGEILLGAGGGGGLDVGSGLLIQPTVSLTYRLISSWLLGFSFGHVWAPDGALDSHLIGFDVSKAFILPNNSNSH